MAQYIRTTTSNTRKYFQKGIDGNKYKKADIRKNENLDQFQSAEKSKKGTLCDFVTAIPLQSVRES